MQKNYGFDNSFINHLVENYTKFDNEMSWFIYSHLDLELYLEAFHKKIKKEWGE